MIAMRMIPSLHERQAAFIPAAHTGNRPNAPNLREGGIEACAKDVVRDVCFAGPRRQKPFWMRAKTTFGEDGDLVPMKGPESATTSRTRGSSARRSG